jgi:hypothetical protein
MLQIVSNILTWYMDQCLHSRVTCFKSTISKGRQFIFHCQLADPSDGDGYTIHPLYQKLVYLNRGKEGQFSLSRILANMLSPAY